MYICTLVSFVPAGDDHDFVVEHNDVSDYVDNDDAPDQDGYECTQVAFDPADVVVNHFIVDVIDAAPDHDDYEGVGSLAEAEKTLVAG